MMTGGTPMTSEPPTWRFQGNSQVDGSMGNFDENDVESPIAGWLVGKIHVQIGESW